MLNLDLIDNLYAGLTKEQQQDLICLLFKKSKQTMSYFRRTKDISLSKLEVLADFFHMPLDYFRVGSSFRANNVNGNNNNVGNVSVNTNLMIENQALRKDLDNKESVIKAKDETIDALKRMNNMLQAQIDNNIKREE